MLSIVQFKNLEPTLQIFGEHNTNGWHTTAFTIHTLCWLASQKLAPKTKYLPDQPHILTIRDFLNCLKKFRFSFQTDFSHFECALCCRLPWIAIFWRLLHLHSARTETTNFLLRMPGSSKDERKDIWYKKKDRVGRFWLQNMHSRQSHPYKLFLNSTNPPPDPSHTSTHPPWRFLHTVLHPHLTHCGKLRPFKYLSGHPWPPQRWPPPHSSEQTLSQSKKIFGG